MICLTGHSKSSAHLEPFTSQPSPGSGKFRSVSQLLRVFFPPQMCCYASQLLQDDFTFLIREKNSTINTEKESSLGVNQKAIGVGVSEASVKVASDTLTRYRRKTIEFLTELLHLV